MLTDLPAVGDEIGADTDLGEHILVVHTRDGEDIVFPLTGPTDADRDARAEIILKDLGPSILWAFAATRNKSDSPDA